MKHLFLAAALLLVTHVMADTSVQIAKDYNKQAEAALDKPKAALKKAAAPLMSARMRAKDSRGADLVRYQLQFKIDGQMVNAPAPGMAELFQTYDAARVKALEPVQKAALARISAMRLTAEGKKPEVVAALDQLRTEIDAAQEASEPIPAEWRVYACGTSSPRGRLTLEGNSGPLIGKLTLNPDGSWQMEEKPLQVTRVHQGQWKRTGIRSVALDTGTETWKLSYRDDLGRVLQGSSDMVFIKPVHP